MDDMETLYLKESVNGHYQQRYALAHSMGGAILTLFLARQPQAFHAVTLVAPMFGIALLMPAFLANRILDWAEKRPAMRNGYSLHWVREGIHAGRNILSLANTITTPILLPCCCRQATIAWWITVRRISSAPRWRWRAITAMRG